MSDPTEKKILLVDDEPAILTILDSLFRSDGYSPRRSMNGEEALAIMKRDSIRVVFTDLRMPTMDGMELCRRAKQLAPDACVYALSAFVGSLSPDQLRAAGFEGYFAKPFSPQRLLDACRQAFEKLEGSGKQGPAADGNPRPA